jgi:tRNA nucleotidyltransferase (CCA-adding enzyme)
MEIEKTVHEAREPGFFLVELEWMGWIDLFPEIQALKGVDQDPEWHPEGNVLRHTCHALDYWAKNLRTGNKEDDLITAIAILCHDFGKATTTEFVNGRFRAHGHEEAGVIAAEEFLHRLRQYELAEQVTPLVGNHLAPVRPFTKRSIRRLSTKVKRMDLLCLVSKADTAGRPPLDPTESHPQIEGFEQAWRELDIPIGGPKPLVGGGFFLELGLKPGPEFGPALKATYERQLDTDMTVSQLRMFAIGEFYRRRRENYDYVR